MMRRIGLPVLGGVLLLLTACLPRPTGEISVDCPLVPGEYRAAKYIDGQGHTGITGQVILKEGRKPIDGAYVNIYQDTFTNLLGPSQFISSPTDAQGRYTVDLPPGTYYVVGRKRMTGEATGPLSPGDFYSEHQRIVTQVVNDKYSVVDLPVVKMKAPMFFKREVGTRETDTAIRGRLVDSNGKPVPGAFAMAYKDADMKRLPDYASTLTDAEGRFTIFLGTGGTYYLSARIHVWDMPQRGEPYGKLDQGVAVEKGQVVEGVLIPMSPFTGDYQKGKSQRPF